MTEIIIDDEQAKLIAEASTAIPIRDRTGKLVGVAVRLSDVPKEGNVARTASQIVDTEKRLDSGGPWYSTEQVLSYLRSLKAS